MSLTGPGLLEILRSSGARFADLGAVYSPNLSADEVHWVQITTDPEATYRTTLPRPTVIVHAAVDTRLWLLDEPVSVETAQAVTESVAHRFGAFQADRLGPARPIPVPGKTDDTGRVVTAEAMGDPVALVDLFVADAAHRLATAS